MPSLRKKVSSFIRQLSVANQQAESVRPERRDRSGTESGCFIQRYLSGQDVRRMAPTILHGRNPHELPPKALGKVSTGPDSIFAALTGPEGGLTTVNQRQRHITTNDPDVDYIDLHDQTENDQKTVASSECIFSPGYGRWFKIRPPETNYPINNSVMRIRAAGSVFTVGTKSVHTSMSDLQAMLCEDGPLSLQEQFCHQGSMRSDDLLNENDSNIQQTQDSPSCRMNDAFRFDTCEDLRIDKSLLDKLALEDEANSNRNMMECSNIEDSGIDCSLIADEDVIPPPADFAGTPTSTLDRDNADDFIPLPLRKSKSAPNPFQQVRASEKKMQDMKGARQIKMCETAAETVSGPSEIHRQEEIAGVCDWNRPHNHVFGAATTLYELHPVSGENAGNPIADCFAIVARENSAVMALADGVNWGQKACVAARSAVHGCVEYLNKVLFSNTAPVPNSTTEVFVALLRSFHAAHSLILQEEGMLTTLTAALVLPLAAPGRYVACVCNVGDSLAYVYNPRHGVREITQGSHDIHCMRDMRDALGALGPVAGSNPELNNLTCSMTEVQEGDIVFLTSDGISDNFDPVVGKFAVLPVEDDRNDNHHNRGTSGASKPSHRAGNIRPRTASAGQTSKGHARSSAMKSDGLPMVQAYQRHELTLLRMEDLLKLGVSGQGPPVQDARELCDLLLDFATRITAAKRHILEDPDLYCVVGDNNAVTELSKVEQRARRRKVCDKLAMVPGKLDHATVVAYQVGVHDTSASHSIVSETLAHMDQMLETGL